MLIFSVVYSLLLCVLVVRFSSLPIFTDHRVKVCHFLPVIQLSRLTTWQTNQKPSPGMRHGVFKDARQSAVWFPNGHSHILIKTHKPDRLTQQILTVHTLHDRYAKVSVTPKCVSHIVFNCLKIMSCIFDSQPCSVLAAEVSSVYNILTKKLRIYIFLFEIHITSSVENCAM